jgi:hypothetical protein
MPFTLPKISLFWYTIPMSPEHTLTLSPAFTPAAFGSDVRAKTCSVLRLCIAGVCIALVQTLIVPVVRQTTVAQAQSMLFRWDSQWYAEIALRGYHSSIPAYPENLTWTHEQYNSGTNVAFFPAYPVLINVVRAATGLPVLSSMLLISQLFAAVFWTYVLVLLARLRIPVFGRCVAVLLMLAHPGAFFQIAAYSESLFLANMMGFLYWNLEYRRRHALLFIVLHGFLLSATKLVAMPIVLLPLVLALWRRSTGKRESLAAAVYDTALSATGGLSFLLYCWLKFGHWDLYLQRQRMGWGIRPDLLFWLHWPPRFLIPNVVGSLLAPAQICRFVVAATSWFFVAMVATDILRAVRRTGSEWTERIALYWCALSMFYVFVAGFTGLQMEAMVRHLFGTYVLLVLLAAHALRMSWKPAWSRWLIPAAVVIGLFVFGCGALQQLLIMRFTSGQWVA